MQKCVCHTGKSERWVYRESVFKGEWIKRIERDREWEIKIFLVSKTTGIRPGRAQDWRNWRKEDDSQEVHYKNPDSEVHGANMGPIWGRQDPGGPHELCYQGICVESAPVCGLFYKKLI